MSGSSPPADRIYLDNAATSWPKPPDVPRAVEEYLSRCGAAAGRGSSRESQRIGRQLAAVREDLRRRIGAASAGEILFTFNGTDALNLALQGLLRPGDHVVTTDIEHNSVLRPLRFLREQRGVQVRYVPCDGRGWVDPEALRRALQGSTRLVVLSHASNVTGCVQDAAAVGAICRDHGATLLVDAAQTAGLWPIDVRAIGCDLLAASGHKGLLGPLGTGFLYLRSARQAEIMPLRFGGTGTDSHDDRQPASGLERFESGNLNVPGLIGLQAALQAVGGPAASPRPPPPAIAGAIAAQDAGAPAGLGETLRGRLIDGLREIPGVRVVGPGADEAAVPVVSCCLADRDPREVAMLLDLQSHVEGRAGFHCAPRIHAALGSAQAGTLRLSPGHFNTLEQIDRAVRAVHRAMTLASFGNALADH